LSTNLTGGLVDLAVKAINSCLPSFQNALALAVPNSLATINAVNKVMPLSSGFSKKWVQNLAVQFGVLEVWQQIALFRAVCHYFHGNLASCQCRSIVQSCNIISAVEGQH
jgi:hypothetical protein